MNFSFCFRGRNVNLIPTKDNYPLLVLVKHPQSIPERPSATPPPIVAATVISESQIVYYEEVTAFYERYNPGKLSSVGEILQRYQGREEELVRKLYHQYNVPIEERQIPVPFYLEEPVAPEKLSIIASDGDVADLEAPLSSSPLSTSSPKEYFEPKSPIAKYLIYDR
jgi:hypothetical protein